MKKIIAVASAVLLFALTILVFVLVLTERIMFQYPVLIQSTPKFTYVVGDCQYRRSPKARWELAIVGRELEFGSEVKTGKNAQADIRFHKETAIKIRENTQIKIDDLTVKKLRLSLDKGAFYGKFERLFKNHNLEINTTTMTAAIRGTELGFEVTEEQADSDAAKKKDRKKKAPAGQPAPEDTPPSGSTSLVTAVYSLSGITEINNPRFKDQKIFLSQQNKIIVRQNEAPGNPVALTEEEVTVIRSQLNSIHYDEVLFISDKISFDSGSAEIQATSFAELDKIAKIIKEKRARIRIEGHTDNEGNAAFNQTLSVNRAEAIRQYFIKKGIDPEKLETAGFGISKPIGDNTTPEGRAVNRRVEFIVVD